MKLTPEVMDGIVATAVTIAHLDGKSRVDPSHLAEAIQYRPVQRPDAPAKVA